ncbi:uncharacterized protein [Montipora foliosa]|uniref:uncharacterized protein n=1 Tax=Montipora foliosa TaxID=591990 RepID=UPI0035F161A6
MPIALLSSRKRKTTTLIHYGHVETKPRDLQARILSPTRRHNPQPLGLVYQSPLHSNAQPYAIWNPDFRHTRTRYPSLMGHLDLTNFSCGPRSQVSPYEERGEPPKIHYSLQSTSRFVYRDPSPYISGKGKWPSHRPTRPEPDGPAVGIIPPGLPRLSEKRNVVNARQGSDEKLNKHGWNNAALREIRRYTGHVSFADQPSISFNGKESTVDKN